MRPDPLRKRGTNGLRTLLAVIPIAVFGTMGASASALGATPAPAWSISSTPMPTNFAPGDGSDNISLLVRNSGGAATDGSTITVTDALPPGLTATGISGTNEFTFGSMECTVKPLSCTFTGPVPPGDIFVINITVSVEPSPPPSLTNSATVSGGGAAAGASVSAPITLSATPARFGIPPGGFSMAFTGPDGSTDLQAGAHADLTVSFPFSTVPTPSVSFSPVGPAEPVKDTRVSLSPGVLGNPQAVPQCARIDYDNAVCPVDTQIGIGFVEFGPFIPLVTPIYNLVPQAGHPADFGVGPVLSTTLIHIIASVRSDGDYGVTETSANISEALPITRLALTFWGIPADPSHDASRFISGGVYIPGNNGNPIPDTAPRTPFLFNPTRCSGPLSTSISADSWPNPGQFVTASSTTPTGVRGCDALSFEPSLSLQPDTTQAYSPSGYTVDLKVPQALAPKQLGTPTLQNATVTLPQGVVVSPGQADGLGACPFANDGVGTTGPPSCDSVAPSSKIGSVEITTPLLPDRLEGSVYLLESNPPNVKILLAASADGVNLKLGGDVHLDQSTGQITTTFTNNPQLPFSDLVLHFNGGPRAPLANPRTCTTFTTTTDLSPWSSPFTPVATPFSSFATTGCGDPNQFAPLFTAGTTNPASGAYSPFVLSFSRTDTDQQLSGLSVTLPPGLLASIRGVPLCSDADANAGTCPGASQVGTVQTGAGPGPDPLFLPGKVFLTGPYKGGPYGLAVEVPAIAGPFNLGTVVVRQSLRIDPTTTQITAVSDPFPTMLDGVPLQLRRVDVTLDRPNFTFNPTSCEPSAITGALTSVGGLSALASSRFQVGGCASLPFRPSFTVSTQGRTSKANGASLTVKVAEKPGEANIHKVNLQLPLALPSRLTTLQKACTEAQFNANPAGCPEGSNIGTATAVTPVLNVPLTGPAYLVSHGAAAFPDVEFVLQGEGVEIVLDGKTNIKKGITYSNFETVPDAPISSFETVLPEGPHSALAANGSLCSQTLVMPTTIVGQNGAQVTQSTNIAVTGCGKPSIKITKAKIKGNTVLVTVTTTQHGTVTVSGNGLKTIRKMLGAGAHQLKVSLTKNGRTARKLRRKTKVKASVKDSNGSSSKTMTLKL
jgi:hypothetical protein